ncbi:MAG TPA: HDOD domain-containing protein [Polyangiaceae bacterium]|nr:HDOD domain-containing protein [Polyangiaceae bacterium]
MQAVESNWFGDGAGDGGEAALLAEQSMAAMVGRVLGAKPFPEAARKLEQLTRNDSHIDKVVQVLEGDAALSARLLRLVNSAGYALRIRCSSVRHAAALVGTARLHQVATTAAILDMFGAGCDHAREITRHAATVGSLCRYLAVHFALPRDELATCGFLHDIGKLMLLETEGEAYAELLAGVGGVDQAHEYERARYGFDHGVLAAHVLSSWNIPEPVPQVVAWHHSPARAMKKGGQVASMVQVLRLSDLLSHALETDRAGDSAGSIAATETAQYLDISEPQLAAMWPDLVALYEQSRNGGVDASENIAPRTSVSPSMQVRSKAPATPRQFPCGVCDKPSFGSTCSACGSYVCPEHQVGPDAWCTSCAVQFSQTSEQTVLSGETRSFAVIAGLTLSAAAAIAAWISGASTLAIVAAPFLVCAVLGLGGAVGYVAWQRMDFLKSRRQSIETGADSEPALPEESIPEDAWVESVRSLAPPPGSATTTLGDFESRDTQVGAPATDVQQRVGSLPASAAPHIEAQSPALIEQTPPLDERDGSRAPSQSPDTREVPYARAERPGVNDAVPLLSSCVVPADWRPCGPFARTGSSAARSEDFRNSPTLRAPKSTAQNDSTPGAVPSFSTLAAFERWAESMPPSEIVVHEEERAAGWI